MTDQAAKPTPDSASPSVQQISKSLVYKSLQPADRTEQDLVEIAGLDKRYEGKQRFWYLMMTLCIIAGVGSVVVFFFTEAAPALIVTAVTAACGVTSAIMAWVRGRMNLDNRRYSLVQNVLNCLRTDLHSAAQLETLIDFNSYHQKRYLAGQDGGGMFASTTAYSYSLPWLALKGCLADGSRFRLAITQNIKRKEKRKRKYTKVREAFREKLSLTIVLKPRKCPDLSAWAQLVQQQARLPPNVRLETLAAEGNKVSLVASTDRQFRLRGRGGTTGKDADQKICDEHAVLALFLCCYSALGQCRAGRRA